MQKPGGQVNRHGIGLASLTRLRVHAIPCRSVVGCVSHLRDLLRVRQRPPGTCEGLSRQIDLRIHGTESPCTGDRPQKYRCDENTGERDDKCGSLKDPWASIGVLLL